MTDPKQSEKPEDLSTTPEGEEGAITDDMISSDDDKVLAKMISGDTEPEGGADGGEEPESKDQNVSDDQEPEGYEEGLQALRRWRVPKKVIESLNKDEIADWGFDAKEIQSQGDAMGRRFDQLARETAKDMPKPKSLDEIMKPIMDLDEDAGKAFKEALDVVRGEFDERMQQSSDAILTRDAASARSKLMREYPSLKNKSTYRDVLDRMASLASASDSDRRYGGDIEAIMRDAANLEIGSPLSADTSGFLKEHQSRRMSQSKPTGNAREKTDISSLSQEDREYEVFKALERDGVEAAGKVKRKLFGT